MNYVFNP
jgi:leucyl-tRNA synthetase